MAFWAEKSAVLRIKRLLLQLYHPTCAPTSLRVKKERLICQTIQNVRMPTIQKVRIATIQNVRNRIKHYIRYRNDAGKGFEGYFKIKLFTVYSVYLRVVRYM